MAALQTRRSRNETVRTVQPQRICRAPFEFRRRSGVACRCRREEHGRLCRQHLAAKHPYAVRTRFARSPDRGGRIGEIERHRVEKRDQQVLYRLGLLPDPRAERDFAQRIGKPGLVHRLHAVSGGDCPRSFGSVVELPAGVHRFDRFPCGGRVFVGRSDRRRRSDGDGAPRGQSEIRAFLCGCARVSANFGRDENPRQIFRLRAGGQRFCPSG